MVVIAIAIKTICVWLIICGYCLYLKSREVEMAFTPIIVTSSIGVVIFLAGILNIMPYAVFIISMGGVICWVLSKPIRMIKSTCVSTRDYICMAFFTGCSLLLAFRLHGTKAMHYDNFSHWLTVVIEMLKSDRIPNFESELIRFQGYPTGSAGFCYYVCKIIGDSESVAIWAQAVLLIACACVMFAFVKKVDIYSSTMILLTTLYCLIANIQITELLVDTLISMLGIASLAVISYYKRDLKRATLLSLPIQIFLIAVKNSGILFLLLNVSFFICISIISEMKDNNKINYGNIVKHTSLNLGIPLSILFIWTKHVEYVFVDGTSSPHSLTIDNYKNILGGKTVEDIKLILQTFVQRFFSLNKGVFVVIISIVILGMVYVGYKNYLAKNDKSVILAMVGVALAYLGFMMILALMYLISMPYDEAIRLAAYERYEKQILIWIVGAVVIFALCYADFRSAIKGVRISKVIIVGLMVCLILFERGQVSNVFIKKDLYSGSKRERLENIKDMYNLPEGQKYYIYGESIMSDSNYTYFIGRFVFWTNEIVACGSDSLWDYKGIIENFDYFIIMEEDEIVNNMLESADVPLHETVYKCSDYR